jgi:hypothetical protein
MSDLSVSDLIKKLQDIRIEEDKIIQLLERALLADIDIKTSTDDVARIEDAPDTVRTFKKKDRVFITNLPARKTLALGFTRATTDQDRTATVVDLSGDRIYVITDNKDRTW